MSSTEKPSGSRWASRLARLKRLIVHSPHVLVVPCALFCLIAGLGLYGVARSHNDSREQARSNAVIEAESASQSLQSMLQKVSLPLRQIAELVPLMPTKAMMQRQWDLSIASWWLGTIPGTMYLGLAPLGVFDYLHFTDEPLPPPLNQRDSMGVDLLEPPWRVKQIKSIIPNKQMTFSGPIELPGIMFCVLELPIYVSNVSIDERWGHTVNASYCPPDVCYNPATRTKWWGNVNMGVKITWLLGFDGPLSILANKGYKYQLWQPSLTGSNEPVAISLSGKAEPEPSDVLSIKVPVIDQMWALHVWKDNWAATWILPLVVVVVVGALVVAALVFTTFSSWEEHRVLLHSLLPKETIDRMRQEGRWAAVQDEDAAKAVRLETPAEIMLRIIDDNLAERTPAVTLLLAVREALQRSADVYRPTAKQMQDRMNELAGMDDDVRKALTVQLMGPNAHELRSGFSNSSGTWSALESMDTSQSECRLDLELTSKVCCASVMMDSTMGLDSQVAIDNCPIKSVRFVSETGSREALPWVACQLAACSPLMMDEKGLGGEIRTVLSRWVLMSPAVAELIHQATPDGSGTPSGALPTLPASQSPAQLKASGAANDGKPGELPVVTVMKPILTKLEQVLVAANEWGFDAFALDEASHGRPLSCLGFWLLQSTGLKSWARMSSKKLVAFLEVVEAGYFDNPYHNRRHAADVLQSVHVIMHRSGLIHEYADQLTTLACYIAAIVHDFEHQGCTNDYLVNSSDTLAVRYNDRSPMENHHLAAAWALLKTKEYNILGNLPRSEVARLRKLVIELVLATDMKQHFAIQGQFETLHRPQQDASPMRFSRVTTGSLSGSVSMMPDGEPVLAPKPLHEQDRLLSLQMMLKCADIGHIAAPLSVHLKWVSALESEFFLQGDKEQELGLPISPLCDRSKEGVTRSQLGFFDFVVLPLFKTFCSRFTETSPMLKAVFNNLNHWKSCSQQ